MKRSAIAAAAMTAVLSVASVSRASQILTQWLFDGASTPTTGSGSASYVGQAFASPFANSGGGAPDDPAYPGAANIYIQWNGAQPTDVNGADSVRFAESTVGVGNITFSWDQQVGYRASRYFQVQVTTDGTTWTPVSGGVGSVGSLGAGTASASVSSSGLVTIVDTNPANNAGGQTGITAAQSSADFNVGLSYTLPAGAWENNPNFAIEITSIYNPYETNTTAADYGYVSSYNGDNSTDATLGFIRSSGSGGGDRLDVVTISVPEPSSVAGLAAVVVATASRRRRSN
jgi:hypothetical protein